MNHKHLHSSSREIWSPLLAFVSTCTHVPIPTHRHTDTHILKKKFFKKKQFLNNTYSHSYYRMNGSHESPRVWKLLALFLISKKYIIYNSYYFTNNSVRERWWEKVQQSTTNEPLSGSSLCFKSPFPHFYVNYRTWGSLVRGLCLPRVLCW